MASSTVATRYSYTANQYREFLVAAERLEQRNKEIEHYKVSIKLASSHPRYGAMSSKDPVAALEIPHRLLLLWEAKRYVQSQSCTSVSKHSELLNINISGAETVQSVPSLETRLQKQMSYICQQHKHLRCGSRSKFEEKSTSVLLFNGEITQPSAATPKTVVQTKTLQIHGTVN